MNHDGLISVNSGVKLSYVSGWRCGIAVLEIIGFGFIIFKHHEWILFAICHY